MEYDTRALADAKKALTLDNTNVKARKVCAESLFASGLFELGQLVQFKNFPIHNFVKYYLSALVEFEKAFRVFSSSEMAAGREKCHQVEREGKISTGCPKKNCDSERFWVFDLGNKK